MEQNREQIIKAVKELRNHGLNNGGALGYHAGWCDEVADILENALSRIKELTEENDKLYRLVDDKIQENKRLTAENERLKGDNVIRLPIKVGQRVYVADNGGIREATANEIYLRNGDDATILLSFDCDYDCEKCPFSSWSQEYSGEYSCAGEYGCWDVNISDFGKTVFLTREDAERALKGE